MPSGEPPRQGAEPVQGAGGVIIPPETYWPEIQRICDEYGILLVADEVITAFGRLGEWFGADYFGTRPDLMPFAKGVSAKTFNFKPDGYERDLDYEKLMGIVKVSGYRGYVGIEWEGKSLDEPTGILKTKKLLEMLGGRA